MVRAVLLGTVVVGTLDILEVILFYALRSSVAPIRILQSVAGGLVGRAAARAGGMQTALLGLALHFFIAFVVVTVYVLASRRMSVLRRRPVLMGALYGLAVYGVMNYLVLPLTPLGPPGPQPWLIVANGLFAHIVCIGIPTGLISAR